MNIFALVSLISCIACLFLGNYVFYLDKKNPLNRVFMLFSMVMAYLSFTEFMYLQTSDYHTAYFWIKARILWPFSSCLLFCFTLIYIEKKKWLKNKSVYFLVYLPTLILFIIFTLFPNLITGVPVKTYWGYSYTIPNLLIYGIIGLYGVTLSFLSLLLCLNYFLKTTDRKKKQQTKYVLIGYTVPIISISFAQILLPLIGIRIPELTAVSMSGLVIIVGYGIKRYRLFVLSSATAADNILSTMPDSLILINPDMKILSVNRSLLNLTGYREEELVGKSAYIIFGEKSEEEKSIFFNKLYREGFLYNLETHITTKSGKEIPVSYSCSLIKDKEGGIIGIVAIARDMREIKKLQSRLMQSEKMVAVGQLAGGVAHEINNPMGVILGFAQSIVKMVKEDDQLYMPLKSIERETMRCKKLVEDLLTFSRTGKTQVEKTDINALVNDTLTLIQAQTKVKNIDIVKEYQTELPLIKVNKNQIQQVIVNLCNNAIEAMPEGGKITITTKQIDNQIEIDVSDTGKGMTEEIKKHVFEPFYTTKEVGKGTGLGLSLCHEIVKRHNGTIEIESEAGKGTTFKIKLRID